MLSLNIRNISHDSQHEYRNYQGGVAPSLLPQLNRSSDGGGAAADHHGGSFGVPM